MWLVVGLGNPGKKYERTRHNVGFMTLDAMAANHRVDAFKGKFSGLFARAEIAGEEIALLKPETFMNLSGDSVQPAAAFLKIPVEGIIVVHDELDVPFGAVRIKKGGGHAGHNGLRSLIERLGTPEFVRVRLGVGRPPPDFKGDVADYVLSGFQGVEAEGLPALIAQGEKAVLGILKLGAQEAMNRFNVAPKKPKPPRPDPAPARDAAHGAPGLAPADAPAPVVDAESTIQRRQKDEIP
jgi:peptidyl-tRNA hydrolase, PTH1 family